MRVKSKTTLIGVFVLFLIAAGVFLFKGVGTYAASGTIDSGLKGAEYNSIMSSVISKASGDQSIWENYLASQWKAEVDQFSWTNTTLPKWSGVKASGSGGQPNTNMLDMPNKDASGMWEIYSGEQLMYALEQLKPSAPNGIGIKLMADIDLDGANQLWDDPLNLQLSNVKDGAGYKNITIDGNNKTIYNIGSVDGGWIDKIESSTVKNLTFVSTVIMQKTPGINNYTGIFRSITGTITKNLGVEDRKPSELTNVQVKNSLFFDNYTETNGFTRSYLAPFGHMDVTDATDVYTINNALYSGSGVHVGGSFAVANASNIESCFSVDSTIVSAGAHSGGFISCTDGANEDYLGALVVSECFTNNTVYGNKSTGVFIGGILNYGNVTIENCYTSGSIEGQSQLGGFVGFIENSGGSGKTVQFTNCYSTSIVGMRAGGEKLGGFLGESARASVSFTNCYAAGEVGHIDTNVARDRTDYKTVGGFIGVTHASNTYTDCYYDKQTTGMREWETGLTLDSAINLKSLSAEEEAKNSFRSANDIVGIRGVLTSDSDKSGAGLASHPNGSSKSAGFNGFAAANWIYDGGSNDGKHNCSYPQLSAFYNADNTSWGEYEEMVRVFSYASAATVHEQVWDNCINPAHPTLPTTTYDTVRDLTLRFTMSSYVTSPINEDVNIVWEKDNASTSLYGGTTSYPIIGYFQQDYNANYGRNYWTSDKFAPGITWLTVNVTVGEGSNKVTGSRRLRIVPTANIATSNDQNLMADEADNAKWFDHSADVKLAYSTGSRLNANQDITQSVYPSKDALTRGAVLSNQYIDNGSGVFTPTSAAMPDVFTNNDNQFIKIPTEYMTGKAPDGVNDHIPNSYISVSMYPASVQEVNNNGNIIYQLIPDKTKEKVLQDSNGILTDLGKALNGEQAFSNEDAGRYILEYTWALPDARYIRTSTMLVITPSKHNIVSKVAKIDTPTITGDEVLTPVSDALRLATVPYTYGENQPTAIFTPETTDYLEKEVIAQQPVVIAQQKPVDSSYKITQIRTDFKLLEGTQSFVLDDPQIGQTITVPITYYYDSQGLNSNYTVSAVKTEKDYTLLYDYTNQYYYLAADQQQDINLGGTTQTINDIDADIDLTIIVEDTSTFEIETIVHSKDGGTGQIKKGNTAINDGIEAVANGSSFTYNFVPSSGSFIEDVVIDGVSKGPISTYSLSNINMNHKIEVYYSKTRIIPEGFYQILYQAGKNGKIEAINVAQGNTDDPAHGNTITKEGTNQDYKIVADSGFVIERILVDGKVVTDSTGKQIQNITELTYSFLDIQANHSIQVSFASKGADVDYVIQSYVKSGNGTITPNGTTIVTNGVNQTYTMTPKTGGRIDSVYVDGTEVTNSLVGQTYTFNNVTQNHEIYVNFFGKNKVDVIVNKDDSEWKDFNKTITLVGGDKTYTDFSSMPDGKYTVMVDGVTTQKEVEVKGADSRVILDYYTLILNSGTGIKETKGAGIYLAGSKVDIKAIAQNGYVFTNWTGEMALDTSSSTVTMDRKITLTANARVLTPDDIHQVIIDVNKDDEPWLDFDKKITLKNDAGTVITDLTQVPSGNYTIYIDGVATTKKITVSDQDVRVTLNYYTLTLNKGTGIDNTFGSGVYLEGSTVIIDATLLKGYQFTNWTGDLGFSDEQVTITINSKITMTANAIITESSNPETPDSDKSNPDSSKPDTGDNSKMMLPYALMLAGSCIIGITLASSELIKLKKRNNTRL